MVQFAGFVAGISGLSMVVHGICFTESFVGKVTPPTTQQALYLIVHSVHILAKFLVRVNGNKLRTCDNQLHLVIERSFRVKTHMPKAPCFL